MAKIHFKQMITSGSLAPYASTRSTSGDTSGIDVTSLSSPAIKVSETVFSPSSAQPAHKLHVLQTLPSVPSTRLETVNQLNQRYQTLVASADQAQSQNKGWLSQGVQAVNNLLAREGSQQKLQQQLTHTQAKLKELNTLAEKPSLSSQEANRYDRLLTSLQGSPGVSGPDNPQPLLDQLNSSVNHYEKAQKENTDMAADVLTGVAIGAGIALIVATGGLAAVPLISAPVILGAAGAGAAIKTTVKASNAVSGDQHYGFNDFAYDAGTGAIVGAIEPIATAAGGALVSKVVSRFAAPVTGRATSQFAIKTIGKTITKFMLKHTAQGAANGSLIMSTGNMARAYSDKESLVAVLQEGADGFQKGLLGGGLAGSVVGAIASTAVVASRIPKSALNSDELLKPNADWEITA